MAAEFHGLNLACSPGSVIPAGSGYNDIAYQSCAIAGSVPGSLSVSGDSYIAASFNYHYSNVWRNFGIMLLFTIAFILLAAFFTEILEWSASGSGALEFKNAKVTAHTVCAKDEEEKAVEAIGTPETSSSGTVGDQPATIPYLDTDRTTFTWSDLTYKIPYDGETRILLNGISGYCAPGQMTALVGSSGAGKTTCELYHSMEFLKLIMCSTKHTRSTSTSWRARWGDEAWWPRSGP